MDTRPISRCLLVAFLCLGFAPCYWAWAAEPVAAPVAKPDAPAQPAQKPLFSVRVNGKWGFIDETGKVVIEPRFAETQGFSEGLAAANVGGQWVTEKTEKGNVTTFKGGQWGYIDAAGKLAIETKAEDVLSFSEGLAAVKIDDKWGYIDKSGKMAIEPQFAWASDFSEGLAVVMPDPAKKEEIVGLYGYIERTGRLVIPARFTAAYAFADGLAAVRTNNPLKDNYREDWGFIDLKGNLVIGGKYSNAYSFSEGLALVFEGSSLHYLDRTGKAVLEPKRADGQPLVSHESLPRYEPRGPDEAFNFHEGLARIKVGGDYIILMPQRVPGGMPEPCHFTYTGGKWGFIDKTGRIVIAPQFGGAGDFSEGLAPVIVSKQVAADSQGKGSTPASAKYGYIDKTGKVVIEPKFEYAWGFRNGLAEVAVRDETEEGRDSGWSFGYINKTGQYVWKPTKK